MKKTLGEQVAAYMTANSMNAQALADRVRSIQARSGESRTVTRQNIEGVVKGGIARPRYLPELAAAMGTDVETLSRGRFAPGAVDTEESDELSDADETSAASGSTLSAALDLFAHAFTSAEKDDQETVLLLINELMTEPDRKVNFSRKVTKVLGIVSQSATTPDNVGSGRHIVDLGTGGLEADGNSNSAEASKKGGQRVLLSRPHRT